jgi:large subunit ribosomal protein L9
MKVVFLQDVDRIAKAGEVKDVAAGYGRNYLIPRKLAVLADSNSKNIAGAAIKARAKIVAETEAEMMELAGLLDGEAITLKAKAGANERLYGSITAADVANEIESALGMVVDRRKVEIEEPIRQLGSYEISIRLSHDIIAKITLTVATDGEAATEDAPGAKSAAKKTKASKKAEPVVAEEPAVEEEPVAEEEPAPEAEEEPAADAAEATDAEEA